MRVISYALAASLAIILLFLAYISTVHYFPCLAYPHAYLQARELDQKVHSFRARHGRLPDLLSERDVSELALDAGHEMSPRDHDRSFVIIYPGTPRDYKYSITKPDAISYPLTMRFDGPWVGYDAADRSITCRHR